MVSLVTLSSNISSRGCMYPEPVKGRCSLDSSLIVGCGVVNKVYPEAAFICQGPRVISGLRFDDEKLSGVVRSHYDCASASIAIAIRSL